MPTTSDVPEPHIVLSETSATIQPRVLSQDLSPEDKMILYAALQDIANELRRIKRERKNQEHHEKANLQ